MRSALLGTAAAALLAPVAQAATVTLDNIVATWFDTVLLAPGAPPEEYFGNGTGDASIRWGVSTGFGQSGYDFSSVGSASTTVVAPGSSPLFAVGEFRHVNFPIFPPSIASTRLRLDADVSVDSVSVGTLSFIYDFTHEETTNALDPCPYGGPNGVGVNINGCADRVTFRISSASSGFIVGSVVYTLAISGFAIDGTLFDEFLTVEREVNTAEFLGRIVARSSVITPAPGVVGLVGLSVATLMLRRRLGR